jgi:hypothetical protein
LHRNLQKYLCCNENLMRIRPVLGLPRGQPERDPQAPTGQLKEPHERDCDASSYRLAAVPFPLQRACDQRQHVPRDWGHRFLRRTARAVDGDEP